MDKQLDYHLRTWQVAQRHMLGDGAEDAEVGRATCRPEAWEGTE